MRVSQIFIGVFLAILAAAFAILIAYQIHDADQATSKLQRANAKADLAIRLMKQNDGH